MPGLPVAAPTHTPAAAFKHTSGPRNATIAIVGEAWGEQEDLLGQPFVGSSGQELTRMLREAGIERRDCFMTNTLAFRPPSNNIELLCGPKSEVGKDYSLPPIKQGKYIRPQYLGELDRLREELTSVRPNLVLALGNTACWALLGSAGISSLRGVVTESPIIPGLKVLPTFHPSAVLRQWAYRPIVVADLMKAKREAGFAEIRRPPRWATINPTLAEIDAWIAEHGESAKLLACDIETRAGQITCIGFASSRQHALVIPFWVGPQKDVDGGVRQSYWATPEEELAAWQRVRHLLALPCPKVFQHGLYDLQYIWRMGFLTRNCLHDTMLLHHSLFPEMQKGLGFLGSIYTNESAWKLLNRKRSDEVEKKDE